MCAPGFGVRSARLSLVTLLLVACLGGSNPPSSSSTASTSAAQPVATSDQSQDSASKVHTVVINQFKYQPDTLTVNAGDTVEWKNEDIVPHTVTSKDGKTFDSKTLAKGKSWRYTASQKGTFDYYCTLHPNMKAKLIVQ